MWKQPYIIVYYTISELYYIKIYHHVRPKGSQTYTDSAFLGPANWQPGVFSAACWLMAPEAQGVQAGLPGFPRDPKPTKVQSGPCTIYAIYCKFLYHNVYRYIYIYVLYIYISRYSKNHILYTILGSLWSYAVLWARIVQSRSYGPL